MTLKIAIAGAGPAGSSLAIRLAQDGFNVVLIERERFPRNKLCGEFISPECFRHFYELGVARRMFAAGGDRIGETVFYEPGGRSIDIPSAWFGVASPALGLSRAEMDNGLLTRAKEIGVKVLEGTRVTGVLSDHGHVKGLRVRNSRDKEMEIVSDILIDATGRAGHISKLLTRGLARRAEKHTKRPMVGFKAHLSGADIEPGRCEIYSFPGGYGGLSTIENGLANHCFLIESSTVKKFSGDASSMVRSVVLQNRRAAVTLKNAEPVHDWLAVAVERFGRNTLAPAANVFTVGDAACFIDPFTGSGMLMAFESSELLFDSIKQHQLSPERIGRSYAAAFEQTFRRRLQICRLLRRAAFTPVVAKLAVRLLGASRHIREQIALATRANRDISPK